MKDRHIRFYGLTLSVSGAAPEKILNSLADAGIKLKSPIRTDGGLTLRVSARRAGRIEKLCQSLGCDCRVLSSGKATSAARRLKRRLIPALILPVLTLLWFSSLYIWQIEVEGNTNVSDGEILRCLEELGVYVGCFRPGIDQYRVSNEMLLRISDLSWLSCNSFGSRLVVSVREETSAPDVVPMDAAADVTAAKAGIINTMTVLAGAPMVARGDMVSAGQLLVAANTPDLTGDVRQEHAMAVVEAWTHYELSACTPLTAMAKEYDGGVKNEHALFIFGKRINLYNLAGNHPALCDRITLYNSVTLPGNTVLPLGLERVSRCAYAPVWTPLDEEAARQWLEDRLSERLAAMIDGRIMNKNYTARVENDLLTVTLRAVCLENIGSTVPAGVHHEQTAEKSD